VPLKRRLDCDFSYAGLKNALRLLIQSLRDEAQLGDDQMLDDQVTADLAASFQRVAITHLEEKLENAFDLVGLGKPRVRKESRNQASKRRKKERARVPWDDDGDRVVSEEAPERRDFFHESAEPPVLAVVGGVAANAEVRRRIAELCERRGWRLVVPPPRLCTDNGVMIAWSAVEKLRLGISDDPRDTDVYARWPFKEETPSEVMVAR